MARDWSSSEVEAAVEDYFDMLRLELMGDAYNKSAHRRALQSRLNERSDGAIERKHQNVSAVLIEMGIPYIDGYKPLSNYQRLLSEAVDLHLRQHPELLSLFRDDSERVPETPTVQDLLEAMEKPPSGGKAPANTVAEPPPFVAPGENYIEREARNRSLGEAGEQFAINYERARLMYAGKDSLANRIEQVSATIGPAAGYDIRSFEENGSDRFIEAKTTKHGKSTPFFVTPNELDYSRMHSSRYFLYRVFSFRKSPRIYSLHGHLGELCILQPTQYLARPS